MTVGARSGGKVVYAVGFFSPFFFFFRKRRKKGNRRPSLFADLFTEELNASRLDSSCTIRSTSLRSKLYESFWSSLISRLLWMNIYGGAGCTGGKKDFNRNKPGTFLNWKVYLRTGERMKMELKCQERGSTREIFNFSPVFSRVSLFPIILLRDERSNMLILFNYIPTRNGKCRCFIIVISRGISPVWNKRIVEYESWLARWNFSTRGGKRSEAEKSNGNERGEKNSRGNLVSLKKTRQVRKVSK